MKIKEIISKIVNTIFPVKCVCCKKLSENALGEDILCEKCREALNRESAQNCKKCKNPPYLCRCKWTEYTNGIIFPYFYSGHKIRKSIYAVKKANLYYINEFFAKSMYNSLRISDKIKMGVGAKISINEFDYITNAPRRGESIRLYGYNQTAVMAKMISQYSQIAYLPIIKASKQYDTEQKNLSRQERSLNVRDKFKLLKNIEKNAGILNGKNILIIDDVVTTGSTLSECARVMKEAGAKSVFALCAAAAFM